VYKKYQKYRVNRGCIINYYGLKILVSVLNEFIVSFVLAYRARGIELRKATRESTCNKQKCKCRDSIWHRSI